MLLPRKILDLFMMFLLAYTLSGCLASDEAVVYMETQNIKDYKVLPGTMTASDEQVDDLEDAIGDRIFFAFDRVLLDQEAKNILHLQSKFMMENPDLYFVIEGHCDQRGTREYNLGLGERRANAVKSHLVSLGVSSDRLTIVSYGKERPAFEESDNWHTARNRRAVTVPR